MIYFITYLTKRINFSTHFKSLYIAITMTIIVLQYTYNADDHGVLQGTYLKETIIARLMVQIKRRRSLRVSGYRYNGDDQCKCLGCGQQEQYVNCADIEIIPFDGWAEQTSPSPRDTNIFVTSPILHLTSSHLVVASQQSGRFVYYFAALLCRKISQLL